MNTKKVQAALKEEYLKIITDNWHGDEGMIKYSMKKAGRFVKLESGHILVIKKPTIIKSFCFGYRDTTDGSEYDAANEMAHHASTDEDYFKAENLKQLQETVDTLNNRGRFGNLIPYFHYTGKKLAVLAFDRAYAIEERGLTTVLNETDKKAILEAYALEIVAFEKRLNTYLKRYGLKKVQAWSYWADA